MPSVLLGWMLPWHGTLPAAADIRLRLGVGPARDIPGAGAEHIRTPGRGAEHLRTPRARSTHGTPGPGIR